MPQDRESGARARQFGYKMAQQVAQALDATIVNPARSNEAAWHGRRILIKSAHRGVPEIGATEATLDRVDAIVAALQDSDGGYTLYEVIPSWFRQEMKHSRSRGASHVMMVRCDRVRQDGRVLGHLGSDIVGARP